MIGAPIGSGRMNPRRIVAAPPRPLTLLLVATAIVGGCWALIVPPFQAPDEQSHFGYAQTLAERGKLPDTEPGRRFSTEQAEAADAAGTDQLAANLYARPEWSRAEHERWRRVEARYARDDGGGASPEGANPARSNPPLYYAYEGIPYLAASGGDLFDRLYLMRLWSVLLLLVAVAATWALVGELVGRRRSLQLTGAAIVGMQPMATFVSASVNPDALLIAAFAVALWAGVRVIGHGLTPLSGVALCAVAAVAILTKATGYALLPAVGLALLLGARRAGVGARSRELAGATPPLLALAVPVGAWLAYARLSDRPAVNQVATGGAGADTPGLFSYLWQFYLPHVPGQQPLPSAFPPLPAIDFWLEGGWGRFGWLEVTLPGPVYVVAGLVTVAALVGAVVALVRSGVRRHLPTAVFLGLVSLTLLAGLHATEYRMLGQSTSFNQGRYLLPLLPVLGVAAAATLSLLGERGRQVAAGSLVALLLVLQTLSLAVVGARFHA